VVEFLQAVGHYTFLQYALLASLLASVACGVVGSYVVVRRITYIAAGIAHSVLGGLGLAHYLAVVHGWTWLTPVMGAVVAALAAAMTIGWVTLRAAQREDTVIGAIWAIGMASGILFVSQTPGYNQELMSYLFGNILMVGAADLWQMLALDVVILVIVYLLHSRFLAVCFDDEFTRVRGLRVELYFLLLLALTALTVVTLVMVVGVVLVIALLTIPVAIAGRFTRTMGPMMVLAVLVSMAITVAGLALSYQPNLPAGATIVLVAGGAFLVVWGGERIGKVLRSR